MVCGLSIERGIPARLADGLALAHEGLDARVVAQEMRVHVHDELVFERVGALLRHGRRRGLRPVDAEDRAEGVVHGDEGCRHAGGALKEGAAGEALLLAELVAHIEQARLHLALLLALGRRDVLVAGDDLRRDRRGVRQHLGRHQRGPARPGSGSSCDPPQRSGVERPRAGIGHPRHRERADLAGQSCNRQTMPCRDVNAKAGRRQEPSRSCEQQGAGAASAGHPGPKEKDTDLAGGDPCPLSPRRRERSDRTPD